MALAEERKANKLDMEALTALIYKYAYSRTPLRRVREIREKARNIKEENVQRDKKEKEQANETLVGEEDFYEGDSKHKFNYRYENVTACKYDRNMASERWSEPRMVTMY